jgi:hypothetical protein
MHHLNGKKGNLGLMALKIDMAKAYDKVTWSLLEQMLRLHGYAKKFISLLSKCISASSFSILISGSPYVYFSPNRGPRQEDSMYPGLFVIYFDLLSRMLSRAKTNKDFHDVKLVDLVLLSPILCMPMI